MNVLIFSEASFPRHPGGAGKSTHVLAVALAKRGHRVRILCECKEADEVEQLEGVEVHRLNLSIPQAASPNEREAAIAQRLLAYVEERLHPTQIDLLYDSGAFLSFFFEVARELKRRYGTAYLLHYRYVIAHDAIAAGGGVIKGPSRAFIWFESQLWETTQCSPARWADVVVCPSALEADFLQRFYRPASGAPQVLPEPVEPAVMDPEAARQFRSRIATPAQRLIYFGGRIDSALKGAALVAGAFRTILRSEPRARLVLTVKTPGVPRELWRVRKQVLALPWLSNRQELNTLLASMDVALMPSRYESFGLMCLELLSVGTPVIASPVGGMPQMIRDGYNGYLLSSPAAKPEELAERCLQLLAHPQLSTTLRLNALASTEPYTVENIGARAEALCEAAVERRQSARLAAKPCFSPADEQRYADLLVSRLGEEAREPAAEVLSSWADTAESRCRTCTRSKLARSHLMLATRGPLSPMRRWQQLNGSWSTSVNRAVAEACPLGLVQRDILRRGS